jgi:hypothetical protein
MVVSRHQNAGQNHIERIENVTKLKYLGTTVSLKLILKNKLNCGSASCNSVQILLPSRLLCKNLKIKIFTSIILCFVLYACETWSLKLREGNRLRVFDNRVLKRIFGPKREEVAGG